MMTTAQGTGETDSVEVQAGQLGLALLLGLIAAVCALLLFAWLAYGTRGGSMWRFDETIRAAIHHHASPARTGLMRMITQLGSPAFLLGAGGIAGVSFALLRWRRAFILFALAFCGAILLNQTLKLIFHRTRPSPFFDTPLPGSYSFPSGHALWSFCFYGALAAVITARIHSHAARFLVWAVALALVLLIGLSRIYLGVHYPSDVLAGYAVALIWVVLVALGDHLLQRRRSALPKSIDG